MTSGVSIFLIAVGAILYFAVTTTVSGIDISTVGVVLMIVGALGLAVSLLVLANSRVRQGRTVVQTGVPVQTATTVVAEDDVR